MSRLITTKSGDKILFMDESLLDEGDTQLLEACLRKMGCEAVAGWVCAFEKERLEIKGAA